MSAEKPNAFIPYAIPCAILTLLLVFVPAASPASNSIWTNKGPDGGTIWCIAVDPLAPATLYAGTASGGIFKSTDKGENWTGVNAGLTDFSIMAIAVDPRNTRTVYIATVNAGMFKSTDGGESWTAINSGLPDLAVETLAIDPMNADTVYVGTAGAGVFKSTDGGHNWTAVNAGLKGKSDPDGEWVVALAIDRRNSGTVYAGTGSDGVFKTDNGGQTWTAVNTGFSSLSLDTLIIDPLDGNVLYAGMFGGQSTGVWKTVNGGDSWNPVAGIGLPQFSVVASLVIDANNPKTIYAIGYLMSNSLASGIFKSSNGGDTWTALSEVPDGQIPPLAIDPQDSSTIYAGSTNSGIYKSTDGGNTWMHSTRGISGVTVYGLTVDRANWKTVYASTSQGLLKSNDGGNTWVLKLSDPMNYPVVIDPSNPATIYVANGDVLKSTDGGESWRHLDGVHRIVALAIDPNNPKTLYGGESNAPFGPPLTVNGVYRTDDGGETWRPANGGLPTSRITVGFVAVDPKNSATVYAATLYYSATGGGVFKSSDGGGSWRLVSDEQTTTAMVLDTQNTGIIYAGTAAKGLFKTVDGGASWSYLDNLLKGKFITALAVHDAAAVLYAGTLDGEIFRSTDAGDSWTQLNSGLTMPRINSLASDPQDPGIIYAGTGGGVFKLEPLSSERKLEIPAGGAALMSTAGSEAPVQSGYATATIDSGSVPSGVAVFSFKQNGVVVSEAGVPASPPTTSARIFVEYRSRVAIPGQHAAGLVDIDTGVAVVNHGSLSANITYTLRNGAGAILTTGHGSLAGGAHLARFVNQLNAVAPDFKLPDDFSMATQFGSLDIASDQPLSVLALRFTMNQRNEALMTTTPIADLTVPLRDAPLYFPHFVDGGGYVTTLMMVNTSGTVERGTMSFYAEDGQPLTVRQAGGPSGSTFAYNLQPGGVYVFQTDGSPAAVNTGSVQLIPNADTSTPAGAEVFGFSRNGVLVTESGVPAAEPTTHARIYVDQSGSHGTGLALAALPGSGPSVALKAYQVDGSTPAGSAAGTIVLNHNGHSAGFVSQLIPGLPPDFTGLLDISSAFPFVALTLRSLTNIRGDFLLTTFPVADSNRPASFPIVFPQIADGGGYVTQFILLNATDGSKATLQLWDDSGTPLAIGNP